MDTTGAGKAEGQKVDQWFNIQSELSKVIAELTKAREKKKTPEEEIKEHLHNQGVVLPTEEAPSHTHLSKQNLARLGEIHDKHVKYNPVEQANDTLFLFSFCNDLLDELTTLKEAHAALNVRLEGMLIEYLKTTLGYRVPLGRNM